MPDRDEGPGPKHRLFHNEAKNIKSLTQFKGFEFGSAPITQGDLDRFNRVVFPESPARLLNKHRVGAYVGEVLSAATDALKQHPAGDRADTSRSEKFWSGLSVPRRANVAGAGGDIRRVVEFYAHAFKAFDHRRQAVSAGAGADLADVVLRWHVAQWLRLTEGVDFSFPAVLEPAQDAGTGGARAASGSEGERKNAMGRENGGEENRGEENRDEVEDEAMRYDRARRAVEDRIKMAHLERTAREYKEGCQDLQDKLAVLARPWRSFFQAMNSLAEPGEAELGEKDLGRYLDGILEEKKRLMVEREIKRRRTN